MTTCKKRINISVSREVGQALARLAKYERIPQATKATRLLEIALEIEEDVVLDGIARKREAKKSRFVSHKKVWK